MRTQVKQLSVFTISTITISPLAKSHVETLTDVEKLLLIVQGLVLTVTKVVCKITVAHWSPFCQNMRYFVTS